MEQEGMLLAMPLKLVYLELHLIELARDSRQFVSQGRPS